ncbi:hypothetical protein TRIUR3_27033 [Triticum urartu]|uniref:carnosine N-methyltransferase n=1 Tax=Triticum urartu TaxID=4572 RepID=M7ZHI4_TRIUA|nr:hypothetical protein TRIUR3_27033 [Triticum urartu]
MAARRYTEHEEALEIKSLRRIIAAYIKYANPRSPSSPSSANPPVPSSSLRALQPPPPSPPVLGARLKGRVEGERGSSRALLRAVARLGGLELAVELSPSSCYQDAAEKDVKRYERSFKKLSPAHKELLFHLGLKYQRLRWCISMNTSFIMNMLEHCCPEEGANTRETENKKDEEVHMVGSSQPAACNLGISQGEDKSCNDGKDASAAANCQDTDCFASSTDENIYPQVISGGCIAKICLAKSKPASSTFWTLGELPLRAQSFRCFQIIQAQRVIKEFNPACIETGTIEMVQYHKQKKCTEGDLECQITPGHRRAPSLPLDVPPVDVDKVRCIIRNIVRDWAQEGQIERDECYKPILEELNRLFPDRSRPPSCLVPGAGLGRLALEISSLGTVCTQEANEWTIYPWIHNNCNSLSDKDQLRAVSFPDIHPSSAGITEGFSMCAGDFVEVYNEESQESAWDAVVTCFFLDTAHNIVEYIEIISKILKDGGVWVNMGPLLYHFADAYGPDDDMSIELSLEDVKRVAYHYGFVMEVRVYAL